MEQLLRLQQQPCQISCVCTSIAIILGLPAQVVINNYHKKVWEEGYSISDILTEYGIEFFYFNSAKRNGLNDVESGYYLVAVPSLNNLGGMHQMVVELDAKEQRMAVLDPQEGTGFKYYSGEVDKDDPNSFKFGGGYTLEAGISKKSLAEWRKRNFIGE